MPLPIDSTLALLAHTNPGESDYTKPKQAMIVRMSTESLNALQAHGEKNPLQFEFGDAPGIHIGGTYFPMRPLLEETKHELYLRTSSQQKPNTPLKLYANVTGKFSIEQREVGKEVTDMLREKTIDAAKQRDGHRTKFIEAPPVLQSKTTKKRKEAGTSSMFRNAIRPSDQAMLNASASSSAPVPRVPSPVPPRRQLNDASAPLRRRLVHCMAIAERQRDQLVKMVAGAGCDASARKEVLGLLEELGEPTSPLKRGEDPASKMWRLKPAAWTEVRPYEWPKLTDQERTALARTGRQKLSSLGISTSDALWDHFKFRSESNNPPSTSSSSATPSRTNAETKPGPSSDVVPKRGVSSKEVKEKKVKPKVDPKAEIQMKNESVKAAPRASNGKAKETESVSQPVTKPAARKPPGSGFKAIRTLSQDSRDTGEGSSQSPVPSRGKPANVRTMKDRELPDQFAPAKPSPRIPPPTVKEKKTAAGSNVPQQQRIKKIRESGAGVGAESDRERLSDRPRETAKERAKAKEQVTQSRERDGGEGKETPTLKRKQLPRDDDETGSMASSKPVPVQKKRKTESGSVAAVSREPKARDLSLPKRPDIPLPQRAKVKTESPLRQPTPLPKIRKDKDRDGSVRPSGSARSPPEPSPSSADQRGRSEGRVSGTSGKRRRSPIYTSSEDEGEVRRPARRDPPPLPTPPITSNRGHSHPHSHTNSSASTQSQTQTQTQSQSRSARARAPLPLPTEHAALRTRYETTYLEYVVAYQKVTNQKRKIQNMLKRSGSGDGSTTDSDGDVGLMDSEELTRLSGDYARLHGELASIREAFVGVEGE